MTAAENPWLSIPFEEYEAHMGSPEVAQTRFLSDALREALQRHGPERVLVLGCATGNGFEHFSHIPVQAIEAVDVNPDYLKVLEERFQKTVPNLNIHCRDVCELELKSRTMDLVVGHLFFEYVDLAPVIDRIAQWLHPDGRLSVILQLPSKDKAPVTKTPYESLKRLEGFMRLVSPEAFTAAAREKGLEKLHSRTIELSTGKGFYCAGYGRIGAGSLSQE